MTDTSPFATVVPCPHCGAKNRVDSRAEVFNPICGQCKAPLGMRPRLLKPIELNDRTFDDALRRAGDRPMLVDCWAAWCGPCRMLAPTIEALAIEAAGRWVIAKLNVDQAPHIAQRFQIGSIPTVLFFHRGELVEQVVGLQPKEALAARLERIVK